MWFHIMTLILLQQKKNAKINLYRPPFLNVYFQNEKGYIHQRTILNRRRWDRIEICASKCQLNMLWLSNQVIDYIPCMWFYGIFQTLHRIYFMLFSLQKQSAYRMHMPITSFATIELQVTFKNNLIQGQNAV